MSKPTMRTLLDSPAKAARKDSSVRQLIVRSIEPAVAESESRSFDRRLSLSPPLVPSGGRRPFDLSSEEICELIEHF